MTTQSELVANIDTAKLCCMTGGPPNYIVHATGTATATASNARLQVSREPTIPTVLVLELAAEHGSLPVLTPVEACKRVQLHGIRTIIVKGRENQREIPVPQEDKLASLPTSTYPGDFAGIHWNVKHFVVNKAIVPVIPGTRLGACFSANVSGTVSGSGGCNVFQASFVYQPIGSINIYDLRHTMRWCETPKGIIEQEERFFDGLRKARMIQWDEHSMKLQWDDGAIEFNLEKDVP